MRRALDESRRALGVSSPNPAVGAVILSSTEELVGVGRTGPPGGPHAEVAALHEAGAAARGGRAVVTLEPCDHKGRTGPCTAALIDAGVTRVDYALADPNPEAGGGARTLRAAGVAVTAGTLADEVSAGPLRYWFHRQRTGRPFVTVKTASTLDGRIAAPDGTSRWITGPAARDHAHDVRGGLDAIVVGTGTVIADDPSLTARHRDGTLRDHQPTRVIVGLRDVPSGARVRDDVAPTVHVPSRDPAAVLEALPEALHVVVEGGPAIIGAFLAAGLVDEIHSYLAPTVLGAGRTAVDDPTVTTLAAAHRFVRRRVEPLGDDLLVVLDAAPSAESC
ncbi:bifunctional diaminohydroxyphosphoribosylaminopyrimidine deaminase/5-amino-6-(5-phosphoribosylamino)uracil reductase RibD [Gordonia shandongensis]|uniref:bifunctional diaminohydroxyphosphoribosylaminopyrimidine deaminase/5-amino-6-(5-phosphoribosylamino)uracil reductase RibD n=1 Tax=Gordonia shandongensis TaxID=376351 RepID=UPI0003FD7C1A|nr:bifunctional diaminohydroxyphosphoribosylaminopyrimidine deaminase/5-amino-6-(5-phosphoribosylamino)uracil reductase RibD [Gordonia shandongensis]